MARGTQPEEAMLRLLEDARAGSSQALDQLLDACRPYLLVVANRQYDPDLRRKAGCSDLLQDTFLEAQRDFSRVAWSLQFVSTDLHENLQRLTDHRDVQGRGKRSGSSDAPCPKK